MSLDQSKLLIQTKLHAPSVRPDQVARPHLIGMLSGGMDKKLTLVSAPAGYGKTALVSAWLKGSGTRCAWLSLDSGDNDPMRFLQYLIGAIQAAVPGLGNDSASALQGVQPGKYENAIDLLTNELSSVTGQFVLVLDDFHVINGEAVANLVLRLLEHLPDRKRLVLLTRIDPPLPLARLRVRGQLVDIRADQLRFRREETAALLNEGLRLALSAEDLSAIEARTEGWIAGLQLAGLSMQSCPDVHAFVSAFSGSHHYVMDYLMEEVLKLQPRSTVDFVLRTSILDQMCAPLCETVVGADFEGVSGGQAMLEALEAMNLFVVPLDDERRWYRYHHLFADVLRKRLEHQSPQLLAELHRRASQWYEQNGLIAEAIQQAIQANDGDRATKLTEDNGCNLMISGEVATLLNWIEAVEFQPEIHPWLAVQKAWALALTGNMDRVEPTLQVPDELLAPLEPTPEIRILQGTIATARAYCASSRGDPRLAVKRAQEALEKLPDSISFSQSIRSVATSILGDASLTTGNVRDAARAYSEAVRIGREANDSHMVIIANSNLADVLVEQGQLSRAADIYTQSLQMAVRPDGQRSPLAGSLHAGLGRLLYERNQLDEASRNIHRCIDLCRQWEDLGHEAIACAALARLEQARGNAEGVRQAVRRTEQLADRHPLTPRQANLVESDLARVWLAQGDLERLSQFVEKRGLTFDEANDQTEPRQVILLRLLLAQGDYDGALGPSERLLQRAEASKRMARAIELLVLQALVRQGRKETDQSLSALKKAFALAWPEGYARTFVDEGEPVLRLLHLARSRQIEREYVTDLLSAAEGAPGAEPPPPRLLSGPLTTREVEVLKLIAAGDSNQEIAAKLVISVATVKRHISNIHTKLDAESRTQAVAVARELKLIE